MLDIGAFSKETVGQRSWLCIVGVNSEFLVVSHKSLRTVLQLRAMTWEPQSHFIFLSKFTLKFSWLQWPPFLLHVLSPWKCLFIASVWLFGTDSKWGKTSVCFHLCCCLLWGIDLELMSVGLGHGVDMCKDKDLGIWSENQCWGLGNPCLNLFYLCK